MGAGVRKGLAAEGGTPAGRPSRSLLVPPLRLSHPHNTPLFLAWVACRKAACPSTAARASSSPSAASRPASSARAPEFDDHQLNGVLRINGSAFNISIGFSKCSQCTSH